MYTAQQAQQRVQNSEALNEHYAILCEYDWPNMQEHIDWICTASENEIIEWALGIEA